MACAASFCVAGLGAMPGGQQNQEAVTAAVDVKDAAGKSVGQATLEDTPAGVLIHLTLTAAPAGRKAVHLHETGRCEGPTFESAGGHFNPGAREHGFRNAKGHHAGDMPNVEVDRSGAATVDLLVTEVSLGPGKTSLQDEDGTALVVHASADDYATDPAGAAGDRIACGVVAMKSGD